MKNNRIEFEEDQALIDWMNSFSPTHPTIKGVTLYRIEGIPIPTTYATEHSIKWSTVWSAKIGLFDGFKIETENKKRTFRIVRKLNKQKQTHTKQKFYY